MECSNEKFKLKEKLQEPPYVKEHECIDSSLSSLYFLQLLKGKFIPNVLLIFISRDLLETEKVCTMPLNLLENF